MFYGGDLMNTIITPDQYYRHPYNDTINCARAVELPLAFNYLDWVGEQGRVACEVGAVTPYYRPAGYDVIDPCDEYGTIKDFVENMDFTDKDVLSISTFEHLGFGDYGFPAVYGLAFAELCRIVKESRSCFITWPIGYNVEFDKQVKNHLSEFEYFFYKKTSDNPKTWEKSSSIGCFNFKYGPRGNCIICIYKGILSCPE